MTNIQEIKEAQLAFSAAQRALKTAKDNLAFAKLSPEKKRVAIALDTIEQIRLGIISPQSLVYLDISSKLGGKIESCQACALGSMFACAVNKPELKIGMPSDEDEGEDDKMREQLSKYFDEGQLWLIECAFERQNIFEDQLGTWSDRLGSYLDEADLENMLNDWDLSDKDFEKAIKFGKKFKNDKNRLVAIMNNVAKNKGKFVP